MTTRLILDTDIGTDVDDCLALAVILGSPELQLEGVTCVYGDVVLRARMVLKLLSLRGRSDVPVLCGATQSLLGRRSVYWAGHEGEGLLEPSDPAPSATEHAVDYIVRTVMAEPGQIHLAAIGPLTNVAMALLREPRLAAALAHLTIMGGAMRGPDDLALPYAEHNIRCDPDAAQVVFASGAPISMVPLDVTTKVWVRQSDLGRVGRTPFHATVANQVRRYPRFAQTGQTNVHDPLAVALIVKPDLVEWRPVHVDVVSGGDLTDGATLMREPSAQFAENARVAIRVDIAVAERFVVDRVAS